MNIDVEEVVGFVWDWSNKLNAHFGNFWNYIEDDVMFQGVNPSALNEIREMILADLMQDGTNIYSRMKGYDAVLSSFYGHHNNPGMPTAAYRKIESKIEWDQEMLLNYIMDKANKEEREYLQLHKKAWGVKSPRP